MNLFPAEKATLSNKLFNSERTKSLDKRKYPSDVENAEKHININVSNTKMCFQSSMMKMMKIMTKMKQKTKTKKNIPKIMIC